jgi:hypothetical protein
MNHHEIAKEIADRTAKAVAHYWRTRAAQRKKQEAGGKADQGLRSAVTGGAQMDGFIDLFSELVIQTGIPQECIFRKKAVELPGFFRPTKEWDLLIAGLAGVGPSQPFNITNEPPRKGANCELRTPYFVLKSSLLEIILIGYDNLELLTRLFLGSEMWV